MTTLLQNLATETRNFANVRKESMSNMLKEGDDFLNDLKAIEATLESDVSKGAAYQEEMSAKKYDLGNIEKSLNKWYKKSINHLKTYNTGVSKYLKNVLNNSRFNIDLMDAYTYPLLLNPYPFRNISHYKGENGNEKLGDIKQENQEELNKAIILHLLKIGQSEIVREMLGDMKFKEDIFVEESLLDKFKSLNEMVDDIVIRHDISKVLAWFRHKYNETKSLVSDLDSAPDSSTYAKREELEFKFHMLQFCILLNGTEGKPPFSQDCVLQAYLYSKESFSRFLKDHVGEISSLMTLLLFKVTGGVDRSTTDEHDFSRRYTVNLLSEFNNKMRLIFAQEKDLNGKSGVALFVGEALSNFEDIHSNQSLFINLSNEFIANYCEELKLSSDSSLFVCMLAGFINLPSFYRYNRIQMKLGKVPFNQPLAEKPSYIENNALGPKNSTSFDTEESDYVAPYSFELPFQLPDSSKFLFHYHPIFICPVSKEQLIPFGMENDSEGNEDQEDNLGRLHSVVQLRSTHNPVVALVHCNHLALRDSIWQLSKKGTEVFKCHYCYKRHKYSDVTEAYFIDY